MKVAIVAPTSIPARRANTFQVMKMAQAFVVKGFDVRLATPGWPPNDGDLEVRWNNIAYHYGLQQVFPVEWLPAHQWLHRYDFAWRAVRWARSWGAEIIYTRLPQAAALASLLGLNTILEMHDLPQGTMGPVLFRQFLQGRGARRLVLISQSLQSELASMYSMPESEPFSLVAPDGVDLTRYTDLPDPKQARLTLNSSFKRYFDRSEGILLPGRFTAGYTGHLYPGRGMKLILDMAERLREINFLLVGGEPGDTVDLRNQVKSLGLENVFTIGFVPNADLPWFQAACEVLLMPYQPRVEASSGGDISRFLSPMKMFEYLACGRAILSSDLPVLQEVLSPTNAILLPPGELECWVKALEELRDNPERRIALASQARQDAEQFSWEARVTRIMEGLS